MNETEWLAGEQPGLLLGMVLKRGTERKARLFGGACCRRVWELLTNPRSWTAESVASVAQHDRIELPGFVTLVFGRDSAVP